MPIWTELVILLLFTYALGLGIGWLLWGRAASRDEDAAPVNPPHPTNESKSTDGEFTL